MVSRLKKEKYLISGFETLPELEQFRSAVKENVNKLLRINHTGEGSSDLLIDKTKVRMDSKGTTTDISFYSEKDMKIYCTLYDGSGVKDTVYVHIGSLKDDSGKLAGLLQEHGCVLCVEPRGTVRGAIGEGWNHNLMPSDSSYNCNAAMLGRSILGMRVLDVLQSMKLLKDLKGWKYSNMILEGSGDNAIIALFAAAAVELKGVRLENLLYSYEHVLESKAYDLSPSIFAYGLMQKFDICDLLCAALPADISIGGLLDCRKEKAGSDIAEKAFEKLYKAHGILKADCILKIVN